MTGISRTGVENFRTGFDSVISRPTVVRRGSERAVLVTGEGKQRGRMKREGGVDGRCQNKKTYRDGEDVPQFPDPVSGS